jgi:predicted CXXCH cytochrome family protein
MTIHGPPATPAAAPDQAAPHPAAAAPARSVPRSRLFLAALLATAGCATLFGAAAPPKVGSPPPPWVAWPEAEVATVKDAHDYRGQPVCQRCHTGKDGALQTEPIALCKGCHPQRHGNHPVGVVHKPPAQDLPYGQGDVIVCHTCHDPHDLKTRRKGLRLAFNDLCLRCHQQH